MRRLILFSGGVESTALLTIANSNDILLICDIPRKDFGGGLDWEKCRRIARHFGNETVEFKFPTKIEGKQWMHQINWFIFASHMIAESRGDISEVWWGIRYDDGINLPERKPIFEKCMTAWKILQPTIDFISPLEASSKTDQWKIIPNEIKRYVNWCNTNNNCGVCRKCLEFKKYCGEIPKHEVYTPKKELKNDIYHGNQRKFLSNFLNVNKGNA
jgi:7-cyano-7-deazaguanine synthase in queuosine biosynthesis